MVLCPIHNIIWHVFNYKIKVNGMNITVMSPEKKVISDITEKNKVNYTKKLTDKLKTEK